MLNHLNIINIVSFARRQAFYLLPFAFYLSITSCWLNPSLQGKGVEALQGEWQQDTATVQKKLLTYSIYNFKFNCDSFFVQMHIYSKVNYGADTCMKNGNWTEYAKGHYELSHDTLRLKGFFAQPNWKLKDEGGCFRSGVYQDMFIVVKKTDSLYQLSSTSSVSRFDIHLTKKITCNPKPL